MVAIVSSGGLPRIAYDPGMAILHRATISPSKLELLAAWLPGRAWYPADDAGGLERIAACRLDDPDGEVGVEVIVARAGDGPLMHVPLTYRDAPLDGGERFLVGTTEHSALGKRWIYDACGDPVYAATLAATIRTGAGEAAEFLEGKPRKPLMTIRGTGTDASALAPTRVVRVEDGDPTVIATESLRLTVRRVLTVRAAEESLALNAEWDGGPGPIVLATAHTSQ
jgi:hypothetical protein